MYFVPCTCRGTKTADCLIDNTSRVGNWEYPCRPSGRSRPRDLGQFILTTHIIRSIYLPVYIACYILLSDSKRATTYSHLLVKSGER